jgi:hypothetical protein
MSTKLFTAAFLVLSLGNTFSAAAQYPADDTLSTRASVKKISLDKVSSFTTEQPIPISGITVVNALWDTARLGFLQVGLFNNKVAAVPDKAVVTYLQEYADKTFGALYQPGNPTLMWLVEDLRIGERTGFSSEKAFVRLKATAYIVDNGKYKELKTMDIVHINGGMDVTHKHKNNISNAFKELFQASLAVIDSVTRDTQITALTYEAVQEKHFRKREIPALKDSVLKDGIYLSFASFLQNKPDIIVYEITGKAGRIKIHTKGEKEATITELWGIVKEGAALKFKKSALIPLERNNYGYVISTYLAAYERKQSAILAGAFLGGIAGIAIMNGTSGALQYADAFPGLKPQPEATAIDMETGALIF